MEEDFEEVNEGTINVPKIMNLSNKTLIEKKLEYIDHKRKNVSSTNLQELLSCDIINDNDEDNNKINTTITYDKNKFWFKNEDNSNSTTSKSSSNDLKIKKVTFSTVEIIRVEKYKKYNIMNTVSKTCIQKNMEEVKNKNSDQTSCLIF